MKNHIHLLFETSEHQLARTMQTLQFTFSHTTTASTTRPAMQKRGALLDLAPCLPSCDFPRSSAGAVRLNVVDDSRKHAKLSRSSSPLPPRVQPSWLSLRATFSPAHPLAATSPARPESAKTASSPRDAPCPKRGPSNRLHLSLREWPRLPFTARIERAQFHRARSASKKGTWPLLPHPSEAARCVSTEDHQAPSPPLLRES